MLGLLLAPVIYVSVSTSFTLFLVLSYGQRRAGAGITERGKAACRYGKQAWYRAFSFAWRGLLLIALDLFVRHGQDALQTASARGAALEHYAKELQQYIVRLSKKVDDQADRIEEMSAPDWARVAATKCCHERFT